MDGARVLVTGAGGDIGRATATVLAGLGATVGLVGRSVEELRRTAEGLPTEGHAFPTDLTRADDLEVLVSAVGDRFDDRLDVLVHCAGVYERGGMDVSSVAELDRMYASNVRAPYALTQQLLPLLRRQRGHVVFVNSTQGLHAGSGTGQFAATQHALRAVSDSLREEINSDGVRVLTLHVGRTAGARQEKIFREDGLDYAPELLLQPADVAGMIAHCVASPRTVEVTSLTMRPAIKSY